MPRDVRVDLSDRTLFGNDAADFEDEALFKSYALRRSELPRCVSETEPLVILRAYKGEGKSALLRLLRLELNSTYPVTIVVSSLGSDLSPDLQTMDQDAWARAWKKNLLRAVASEVGANIGLAFTDDAIGLVEEAEANGFKARSFVSAIIDRLKLKSAEIDRTRITPADHERALQRFLSGRTPVWVLIDDVDQNFVNDERGRVKVASFFTACRQIMTKVPDIRFRSTVRPNVWAAIKPHFESLSHVEQYTVDLSWTTDQFCKLLAARVASYLQRKNLQEAARPLLRAEGSRGERALVGLVFDDPLPWAGPGQYRPPHEVLYTLSRHRPRWLVELCKVAATAAHKRDRQKIGLDDIKGQLQAFGQRRLEDTVAEYRSQCAEIENVIQAFSNQMDLYSTDELVSLINRRVMQATHPKIVGVVGQAGALDVAHLLFQIGFITGRRELGSGAYEHISYAEKPTLLKTTTNLDDGLKWEIHPVFRPILNLRHGERKPLRHG